jgi:hypothetical protein
MRSHTDCEAEGFGALRFLFHSPALLPFLPSYFEDDGPRREGLGGDVRGQEGVKEVGHGGKGGRGERGEGGRSRREEAGRVRGKGGGREGRRKGRRKGGAGREGR